MSRLRCYKGLIILGGAFQTCFTIMLNKFEFGKIKETNGIAALMFFLFAVSVSWILVNVLLTIIIDGYEAVKSELEGRKNDLEVIQYIKVKKCQLGIIDVQTNSK